RNPDFLRSELSDDVFNIIHVQFFVLLDRSGQVVAQKSTGWSLTHEHLSQIAAAAPRIPDLADGQYGTNGILELNGRVVMLVFEPVLTTHGNAKPRGTLVMGREMDQKLIATLSKSTGLPMWLEPADHAPGKFQSLAWTDGTNSVALEGDSTMLG